jgi:hypothetical protein
MRSFSVGPVHVVGLFTAYQQVKAKIISRKKSSEGKARHIPSGGGTPNAFTSQLLRRSETSTSPAGHKKEETRSFELWTLPIENDIHLVLKIASLKHASSLAAELACSVATAHCKACDK